MKTLFLIRHAIAADAGASYPDDTLRPLTEAGVDRWTREVRGLVLLDAAMDVILTSPLLRCRQTAALLSEGLEGRPPVEVVDALRPGASLEALMEPLGAHRRAAAVALVGHEPSIGAIVASLLGAAVPVPFKRGAVCRVDVAAFPPRAAGTLVWMLPPRALRRLGEL